MSKLNTRGQDARRNIHAVAAKEQTTLGYSANGNLQFVKTPMNMLYELTVSTMFGKGTFYKSGDQLVNELRVQLNKVVDLGEYDFIANLAIHARGEMNIRTIPIVLVVEFAKALADRRSQQAGVDALNRRLQEEIKLGRQQRVVVLRNKLAEAKTAFAYEHMRALVRDVIQRADQITDLYAYALSVFGSKNAVPMAIKRGVADAFNKFSEYHFAKYNRGEELKFRDVLRIVHPTAKDYNQGQLFEKIMKDQLAIPYTWETELSTNGQLPASERKSKAQLWTELVESDKMGYMALLRNMRNIVEAGVDNSVINKVAATIKDPVAVRSSRQLPFDMIEAYNVIKSHNAKLASAVSKAVDLSVMNVPQIGNKVWLIVDFSGSMGSADETDGTTNAINTATLFAAALIKSHEDVDNLAVTLFGSNATTVNIDSNDSVMGIRRALLDERVGGIAGSTNFGAALDQLPHIGFKPDTVIVLTDGEINQFPYHRILNIPADAMKVAINLSAASTTPFAGANGWFTVAGWSPAMFRWIPAMRDRMTVTEQLSVPYKGIVKKEKIAA